jgi:SRSO17 transposase
MLGETADAQKGLVMDARRFPRNGSNSVCVAREYCGSLGKLHKGGIAVR